MDQPCSLLPWITPKAVNRGFQILNSYHACGAEAILKCEWSLIQVSGPKDLNTIPRRLRTCFNFLGVIRVISLTCKRPPALFIDCPVKLPASNALRRDKQSGLCRLGLPSTEFHLKFCKFDRSFTLQIILGRTLP